MLAEMRRVGLAPDETSFVTLLGGLRGSHRGGAPIQWAHAEALLSEALGPRAPPATRRVWNAAVHLLPRSSHFFRSRDPVPMRADDPDFVKRLSQRKDFVKRLSKRAGEEQVGAAARLGNGARAEELAARMRAAGVAPDQRTYTALVRASGKDTERAAAHVAPLPTPL